MLTLISNKKYTSGKLSKTWVTQILLRFEASSELNDSDEGSATITSLKPSDLSGCNKDLDRQSIVKGIDKDLRICITTSDVAERGAVMMA